MMRAGRAICNQEERRGLPPFQRSLRLTAAVGWESPPQADRYALFDRDFVQRVNQLERR